MMFIWDVYQITIQTYVFQYSIFQNHNVNILKIALK